MRCFLLIMRFYRYSMRLFCGAVTVACLWLAYKFGLSIVLWLLLLKLAVYPTLLYVFVYPRYRDEFYYYINLGVGRRLLLGACCAADLLICILLLIVVLWIA